MSNLEQEQITAIAEIAISKFNELQQEEKTRRLDRRLFNTKILLKNYRHLKMYCDEMKETVDIDEGEPDDLFTTDKEYLSLESIKRSEARTLAMMRFIDNMIKVYEMDCKHLGAEEVRRYNTLMHFYITEEKKTCAEIAELHHVHERTAQRDLKEAVHAMSVLFFGTDGLRLSW
ncbi:hypothetical protein FJQ98_20550 [Lysinibacillus agricola]|uniref:Uncharacterized protein n=1 Tax=Lysinibacillus agricola TaxID=2590012 RepID=A0ABX7ANP2_9BACI|nr:MULTISPECIES: hypothetical protein [Lysinibacillus]KOS60887.1 hypothetical protein AN161_20110 [Lysinibacillus sp. FJAT-14222]QQP11562.1 hypothetical protein FJQ98_20550 [Lysinibacillus agricola]